MLMEKESTPCTQQEEAGERDDLKDQNDQENSLIHKSPALQKDTPLFVLFGYQQHGENNVR